MDSDAGADFYIGASADMINAGFVPDVIDSEDDLMGDTPTFDHRLSGGAV
jgi:hypothetical protein